jgi:hypothetical protein
MRGESASVCTEILQNTEFLKEKSEIHLIARILIIQQNIIKNWISPAGIVPAANEGIVLISKESQE